ncbi:hypothetical protein TPHA_0D03370 [Tetrapisispora phaffii CBS 4417]|uniref:aromatic-amino-acid transaminase n=1 Tax=Tetrapisispora phaffii (strain ATCC 24235 / CBS 4417 / NBRC 1672 / NRRL Y-8282 / UCD 70-5) TaxID=1071381 RepID=G8BT02_TETPH|nr:hypothetical protein TPHA_0D03370 [Tetrapisispora phaffii CBS 4417]CCE62973.1 hypothetical protein TPHA_0D03370 [Tetrapisispora phaffii CBS 4417]
MTLTESKDFSHLFSEETKARKPSPLKTCIHLFNDPNIVFLGGGLPLSDYFPWDNIHSQSPLPPFKNGIGSKITGLKDDTLEYVVSRDEKVEKADIPFKKSLQYGATQGQPEILEFLREHNKLVHEFNYSDWDSILTTGNTNGWESTLRIFCNKGDVILAEAHSFSSSLASAEAQGVITFPVPIDSDGIIPEKLESILDNWTPGSPKPKLLYTIPTGQNPTGSSLSDERKEAIYKIACKHDFIIIEDEPYYFLQTGPYLKDLEQRKKYEDQQEQQNHEQFLKSLAKTFLSLDTEGRVIRMDSFSKVLAPGARLGWLTGSKKILQYYVSLHEMTVQGASGFSQSIINGLLQRWGQDGYIDWLKGLRSEYVIKRNNAIDYLHEFLPASGPFTINPPIAGMFFTVTIDATAHPDFKTKFNSNPKAVEQHIYETIVKNGVLLVPGCWFITEGETTPPQPADSKQIQNPNEIFFRGTYAAVAAEKLREGLKRFSECLKEEFGF